MLTTWPTDGGAVYPFLSSVDNGWLGRGADGGQNADRARPASRDRIFRRDDLDAFYNPDAPGRGGLIHGGFWDAPPPPEQTSASATTSASAPTSGTPSNHYDTTVSETRITTYIGIVPGQIPA